MPNNGGTFTPIVTGVVKSITELSKELQVALSATNAMVVKLLRPKDLLSLEFRFSNFIRLSNGNLRKVIEPALMMVSFPVQSISEGGGTEDTSGAKVDSLPVGLLSSGRSFLVFKINKDELTLTAQDLLNWNAYEPVVNNRAIPDNVPVSGLVLSPIITKPVISSTAGFQNLKGASKQQKNLIKNLIIQSVDKPSSGINIGNLLSKPGPVAIPDEWETVLEIPRSIYLSPTKQARWKHRIALSKTAPVLLPGNSLYELWHTRMAIATSKDLDDTDLTYEERQLRVLWAEGVQQKDPQTAIDGKDQGSDKLLQNSPWKNSYRHQLVHESSNFTSNFTPRPVRVRQLFLTSLGAYFDSLFLFDKEVGNLTLLKWAHLQTLGRTHYVEIVSAGYVAPLGHKAVKVEITERKPFIQPFDKFQKPYAINLKRTFVLITEPIKYYDRHDSKGGWLPTPFGSIEILTTATPLLDATKIPFVKTPGFSADEQFEIRVSNEPFKFKIRGEDVKGNDVSFQMPLVFVAGTLIKPVSGKPDFIAELVEFYKLTATNISIGSQLVALAPPAAQGADTVYPVNQLMFDVQNISDSAKYDNSDEPQHFLPAVRSLNIQDPATQRLTNSGAGLVVELKDESDPTNIGKVFASCLAEQAINFASNADKTGGFIIPNFTITAFTLVEGAVGGKLDELWKGKKEVESYFKMAGVLEAKLFGVFDLVDLISSFDSGKLPQMLKEEVPASFTYKYALNAQLKDFSLPGAIVKFTPSGSKKIAALTTVTVFKDESKPTFSINAGIDEGCTVSLLDGLINVGFKKIHFSASSGKSADINIDMANPALVFGKALTFVNALQRFIPVDGFSDPPYLDVTASGVKCGYTLAIPSIQLGAFTLSNVSLGADVNLPFTGAPMCLGFRFCEKQQPFTLTVAILGGGGYFGFEVDLNGLRRIDAALEFGAAVALNLGVAKGAVSIMAGIYFKMTFENGNNSTQLTGYLRINGAMSIIGLITAAVELYMAFTYLTEGNKVYGEATVKIKVHVLFFSKTVSVQTSRTFSGDGNDPNFQQTYSPTQWQQYCEAFAS